MRNMEKAFNFIWLMNAQVNSLNEPQKLSESLLQNISAFNLEYKLLSSNEEIMDLINKEIQNNIKCYEDMISLLSKLIIDLKSVQKGTYSTLATNALKEYSKEVFDETSR